MRKQIPRETSGIKSVAGFLYLFFLLLTLTSCQSDKSPQLRAHQGILDAGFYFNREHASLYLDGQWEFYPGQLYWPEDFADVTTRTFINVPGIWSKEHDVLMEQPLQYGTYRLRIVNHGLPSMFSVRNNQINSSFRLFVDGKEVLSNGIVADVKEDAVPFFKPEVKNVYADADTLEIILQVSNFYQKKGGIIESPQIGTDSILQKNQLFNSGMSFLLIGSLLIMAIYHLGLFFVFRQDRSPLYFGIFVLLVSFRILVTGEEPLLLVFPNASWMLMARVEYASLYLSPMFFILFFRALFEEHVNGRLVIIYGIVAIIFTLLVVFTPPVVFMGSLVFYQAFLSIIILNVLYWLWIAWLNKKEGAITFLIASSVLFIGILHDFIYASEFLRGPQWFPIGLFLFIMGQAFVLSRRFSGISKKNQQLLKELDFQNKNLENIVKERTQELLNQQNLLLETNFQLEQQKQTMQSQSELMEQINELLEKEKEKTDKLLLNVLPEHIAAELRTHGKSLAHSYPLVSVMFVDFVGFSRIAEKLEPESLLEDLHFYFANFDDVAKKYNLEKIKTIGDAYMCAGGLRENASDRDAISTVKAALEIRDFIEANKEDRLYLGQKGLDCRIGIHTGPVIAGVVGKSKFAFDIWGPAVNIAKQMESFCKPGKVNISENTYNLVKNQFDCTSRGVISMKHKLNMEMFFVESLKKDTQTGA